MPNTKSDNQILREFELESANTNCTAFDFIRNSEQQIGVDLQLKIISIAVEMLLSKGMEPAVDEFAEQFPYLGEDLGSTLADTIDAFVREHCPVTSVIGRLPKKVDGYLIEEEIGRGGMGVVYKAKQLSLDRTVALKVLFLSRDDILQEARSLAALAHPNICGVYDVGIIAGMPMMAMKFVKGQRLTDYIKSAGPLPNHDCIKIACRVAKAMQEAHHIGVAHLDIKPSNVLMTIDMKPMLTDFGLARRAGDRHDAIFGSPSFLAPELLSTTPRINRKLCDIYSLGAVLYEMLTGRRAFHGPVDLVIDQILFDPPRRPSDYRSDISPKLEAVCLKAMSKNPLKRYQSMNEFCDAMEQCRT